MNKESRRGVLSSVDTRIKLLALIALIAEFAFITSLTKLDQEDVFLALVLCVTFLVIVIVAVVILQVAESGPKRSVSEETIADMTKMDDSDDGTFDTTPLIIEQDPSVATILLASPLPPGWQQRALYLGVEGAKSWISVINDPLYLAAEDQNLMRQQLLKAIDNVVADRFASLGPGDGTIDYQLALKLRSQNAELSYIPIDISEGLLSCSMIKLKECVNVPFGILGDFEDGWSFIRNRLATREQGKTLFGFLGNTLGNLDGHEGAFINELRNTMGQDDMLLLEVAVVSDDYEMNNDPRSRHPRSSNTKEFHARGMSRQIDTPMTEILDGYDQNVELRTGRSDVPGAESIDLVYKPVNKKITSLRRYKWSVFLKWLQENNFSIGYENYFLFGNTNIGIGVTLIRKA